MTKQQLRAAVATARAESKRARYSHELRTAVIEYCREGRAEGLAWSELAEAVGINRTQMQSWCRTQDGAQSRLRAVRVVEDVGGSREAGGEIRLEFSGGVVTGLKFTELVALVRELR